MVRRWGLALGQRPSANKIIAIRAMLARGLFYRHWASDWGNPKYSWDKKSAQSELIYSVLRTGVAPTTYGGESIERRMRSCRGCQGRYSCQCIYIRNAGCWRIAPVVHQGSGLTNVQQLHWSMHWVFQEIRWECSKSCNRKRLRDLERRGEWKSPWFCGKMSLCSFYGSESRFHRFQRFRRFQRLLRQCWR